MCSLVVCRLNMSVYSYKISFYFFNFEMKIRCSVLLLLGLYIIYTQALSHGICTVYYRDDVHLNLQGGLVKNRVQFYTF